MIKHYCALGMAKTMKKVFERKQCIQSFNSINSKDFFGITEEKYNSKAMKLNVTVIVKALQPLHIYYVPTVSQDLNHISQLS